MIDVITTAGLSDPTPPANPRRELLKGIRAVIRRTDASEDDDLDALEALVELSKG